MDMMPHFPSLVDHYQGANSAVTKDERAYRSEFRYGTFSWDLALPKGVA
jgi:hypothetical protein